MNSKRIRFLLIEDEIIILESIRLFLIEMGHEVIGEAYSGEEALEILDQIQPEMILMDINLPGIDGITTLNKIQEKYCIPCIYLTGYSDSLTIEAASLSNAFGYLIKPVDKASLNAAICIACERFNRQQVVQEEAKKARVALEERKIIERAKAQLMEMTGMKEPQAMQFMQKKSRNTNTKLIDVARNLLKLKDT